MELYLPLANIAMSAPLLFALGALGGILSGMFGVGGAFIVTPLLIFVGIPPSVAVGTQSAQLAGTALSGVVLQGHKRQLDVRMGLVLAIGSLIGVSGGAIVFQHLRHAGVVDMVIDLGYAVILTVVGVLMLRETAANLWRTKRVASEQPKALPWGALWMFPLRFPASDLTISVLSPLLIGLGCGVLTAIFGVGSGFVLVPAMLYLLRMPASLVAGTSLFQMTVASSYAAIVQSMLNHNVDIILALILLSGSIMGVRLGTQATLYVSPTRGRLILAMIIVMGALKLWFNLIVTPYEYFSLSLGTP